jgi:hypothetical protein
MLFIRLAIISFIYPLICGFTLDYEILTACEAKHPSDIIARTVCNNKLEREKEIKTCATKESKSIDEKIEDLIDLLEISYPSKVESLVELIRTHTKFKPTLQKTEQDPERRVIVFGVPTKCNVGYDLNVNIYESKKKDGVASIMVVWRNDDPTASNTDSYRVNDYSWNYRSTLELKEKYLDSSGYLSEAEYRTKLQNLEIRKIKKIAELFSKDIEIDAKNFQPNSQILTTNFIDVVNRKSLIFKAQPFDAMKQTVTISSDVFPNLKYVFNLKIESTQITLALSSEKNVAPLFTRRIDIPQTTSVEASASNVQKTSSISYVLLTLGILIIGALFIFKESIVNTFFSKNLPLIDKKSSTAPLATDNKADSFFGYSGTAKSDSVSPKPKINHKEFLSEKAFEEFRAKNPFVMVDVDPSLRMQFIQECFWLEKKLGNFPSEKEQLEILNSLTPKK